MVYCLPALEYLVVLDTALLGIHSTFYLMPPLDNLYWFSTQNLSGKYY
jgi:hypothetical protein